MLWHHGNVHTQYERLFYDRTKGLETSYKKPDSNIGLGLLFAVNSVWQPESHLWNGHSICLSLLVYSPKCKIEEMVKMVAGWFKKSEPVIPVSRLLPYKGFFLANKDCVRAKDSCLPDRQALICKAPSTEFAITSSGSLSSGTCHLHQTSFLCHFHETFPAATETSFSRLVCYWVIICCCFLTSIGFY